MERLIVKKLSFEYERKQQILDDISFTIEKGKIISILGASGCGKTTLLHLLASLLSPTEGEIINSFKKEAFLFQEPRLLPWEDLINNILLPLREEPTLSAKERVAKAQKMALILGLKEGDFKKFPKDLSGGMRQRVAFARALIIQPSILFLDEPFSALDIGLKKELYKILSQRVKEDNITVLFITHDLMEATRLSDEIFLLKSDIKGSKINHHYSFDLPIEKRGDDFIYRWMIEIGDRF